MKILIITLNTKGGMIHYISQLANAIVKSNEVYIIAPKGLQTEFFDKSVKIIELNTGNTIKNFILNTLLFHRMLNFLSVITKINPDIIHLHDGHPWVGILLPFLSKYKIITTVHDVTPHIGYRYIDQAISLKIHLKYSDALIVHGKNAKETLAKELKNKNIYIVPHGDYSFFNKICKDEYEEEPFHILFFGNIVAYKGLPYLIQAAPLISDKIPNIKVIIAGSGNFIEKETIEKSPYFEIHNYFIAEKDVGKYFQRASLVVLPYIEGTQTGVIPIAYAFKKPVVVTNVGSIPEVVDEGITGYIVPPKDPNALANAIIKLLNNDSLRKQMGENAYNKMEKELSWDFIAGETCKIYNDVWNAK